MDFEVNNGRVKLLRETRFHENQTRLESDAENGEWYKNHMTYNGTKRFRRLKETNTGSEPDKKSITGELSSHRSQCLKRAKGSSVSEKRKYDSYFKSAYKVVTKKDRKGRIKEITKYCSKDSAILTHDYKYNQTGQVIQERIYAEDRILLFRIIFIYNAAGKRTEKKLCNSRGKVLEKYLYKYQHDSEGRVINLEEYRSDGRLSSKKTYQFNEKGQRIHKTQWIQSGNEEYQEDLEYKYEYKYGQDGKINSRMVTDTFSHTNSHAYRYDNKGRLKCKEYHMGDIVIDWIEFKLELGSINYQYDDNGRLARMVKEFSYSTNYTYTYDYCPEGRVKKMTVQFSHPAFPKKKTFSYDNDGNCIEMNQYDPFKRLYKKIINTYDSLSGKIVRHQSLFADFSMERCLYFDDKKGRAVFETDTSGFGRQSFKLAEMNATNGMLPREIKCYSRSHLTIIYVEKTYDYDSSGRMKREFGYSNIKNHSWLHEVKYNRRGIPVSKSYYNIDRVISFKGKRSFDGEGRVLESIDASRPENPQDRWNFYSRFIYKKGKKDLKRLEYTFDDILKEGKSQDKNLGEYEEAGLHKDILYDAYKRLKEDNYYHVILAKHDRSGRIYELSKYNREKVLIHKQTFKYDKRGLLNEMREFEQNYQEQCSTSCYEYEYDLDNKGKLVREAELNPDGTCNREITYKYFYDRRGNWIKKTGFINRIPAFIIERDIEYND